MSFSLTTTQRETTDTSTSIFQIEDINSSQKNRRRDIVHSSIQILPKKVQSKNLHSTYLLLFCSPLEDLVVSRVLFPSVVKEDLVWYPGCCSLRERFTFVKTKLCGHKEVDVANLKKSGMSSVVDLINQMQWTEISTFSEVSYPDLVKAFFVCMKTEEDGSLVSSVKGIMIRIDPELLKMLFNVKTSGFSGVHTVDTQVKGLGIIGPGFKLRDGKIDINQLSAFNRLLHFIVCQILVPRSATFSSCTKADSDMMYWAIQNKEINMAAVIMERMKFARDQIWDTKSKLNVSLPYAHLLTKIFKHFGVDLSGAVVEKMGQAIRSRNLKKSGFSVENGVWVKASVAECEAIIDDT
ncbi:hypothetical protein Taro_028278 [Colocasia esculenta]|uniref:Putative plant transposon protein domain-containing protein n=1 Tax=Colocasia esculenta TaxID=4460 RepID=A0A843VWT1_COLES|nr:hypothetical protein [Colocasia esculenta]